MRVRLLVTASVVAGVMLVPAAPAAGATKCSGKGAKTIVATPSARVFTLPASGGQEKKAYACVYSQNKKRYLGWIQECQNDTAASGFMLSGRLVGYVTTTCGLISGSESVVVRDIKTNKVKHSAGAASGTEAPGEEASTLVNDLAMSRTGSLVWIGEFDADSGGLNGAGDSRQVWTLDASGAKMVDSGLDIDPFSLALAPRNKQGFSWFYYQRADGAKAGKLN